MKRPSFSLVNLPQEQKQQLVDRAAETASEPLLFVFFALDMKTHIEGKIYNQPTDEWFELNFRKIEKPEQ